MRRWWSQTGGRAAGRRRGRMPIWCLHLSVNVMSSIWQQDDQNRQGAGEKPHTGRINLSLCPPRHSFIITDYVHLHNFAWLFGLFVCFPSSSAVASLLLKSFQEPGLDAKAQSLPFTSSEKHPKFADLRTLMHWLECGIRGHADRVAL